MISIKAKFIGSDSLGFKHGSEYDLSMRPIQLIPNDISAIRIQPKTVGQACEYQSWNSFSKNWKINYISENDLTESVKLFKSTYHTLFENLNSELRNFKIIRIIE